MVTPDEALDALRGVRPADPPDDVASPTSPAARTILQEVLSMTLTDRPDAGREADAADDSPLVELRPTRGPSGGRRRRGPLVAAAVGVAAAALAGALIVQGGDDDGGSQEGNVSAADQTVIGDPMVPDVVPEGTSLREVFPEAGRAGDKPLGPVLTHVYGELVDDTVTDDIVIHVDAPPGSYTPPGEPVTVRGSDGLLCSPGPERCDTADDVTGVAWTEEGVGYVSVESRTYDGDQVRAIAEGLVVDGDTLRPGELPDGVADVPEIAAVNDSWPTDYSVRYTDPAPETLALDYTIITRTATEAQRVHELWLNGPPDDADVQGHPAWVDGDDEVFSITWEAAPGQFAQVLTHGLDELDAIAFAETVRPATDQEWSDLQAEAAALPPDPAESGDGRPDNALHRALANGAGDVWVYIDEYDQLCAETEDDEQSTQRCTEEGDVIGVAPTSDHGEPKVWGLPAVVGIAPVGAASIDGGETTFGDEVDGGRFFIWEFVPGEMPDEITFRDADGAVLATEPVLVF